MSRRRSVAVALLVSLGLSTAPPLPAEDRVTIRPAGSAGVMTLTGDILDYNASVLTLRTSLDQPAANIDSRTVLAVETYRTPAHQSGIEAFEAGRLPDAVAQFTQALTTERRAWVRGDLLAWLVRAHQRLGQFEPAAARFVDIVSSATLSRHWNIAPLVWSAETIPPTLRVTARQWLVHSTEGVRLVGASLLLGDSPQAATELQTLARSTDRQIAGLAEAQLWRQSLTSTGGPSTLELQRWRRDVERMPESVRAGPWYLIGRGELLRNVHEEGASALLRVFIAHADNEPLAARAGVDAGLALTRLNRRDEAATVYREIIQRFAWSTFAAEAKAQLAAPATR